jgi:transcription elongation factor S-II
VEEEARKAAAEAKAALGLLHERRAKAVTLLQGGLKAAMAQVLKGEEGKKHLDTDSLRAALRLEQELFAQFGGMLAHAPLREYMERVRSFHFNLQHNTMLAREVFWDQTPVAVVAVRSTTELGNPEVQLARLKAQKSAADAANQDWAKDNVRKIVEATMGTRVGGTFRCKRCKSEDTDYYQLQTRSSDEPMTTFINCLNCGYAWKVY